MAGKDALRRSSMVLRALPLVVLAIGLAIGFGDARVAAQEGGAMAADCEGNSRAVESDCEFGDGQRFTVAIHIASAPSGGYAAFQAKLRWDSDVLDYRPTEDTNAEAVWPDCSIQARSDNRAGEPNRPEEASVLYGCTTIPFPEQPFTYEGPAILLTFVCTGQGTSQLTLVPREGDPQQGSHFLDLSINPTQPEPTLQGATVACGGAERERPASEIQPREGGMFTPAPGDGVTSPETPTGPTNTPGGPTETPGATEEPTPDDGVVDDDDDDGGLPVWAWIVIGLGAAGGAGGAGFAGWRWLRARGAAA